MHLIYKENNKVNWISPIPPHTYTDYVEVDTLPTYDYETQNLDIIEENGVKKAVVKSKSESELLKIAKEKKIAEIKEYDKSSAVNSFSINGLDMWLDSSTRAKVQKSIDLTKDGDNVSLWYDGVEHVHPKAKAQGLITAVEMYAKTAYGVTQSNIKKIRDFTTTKVVGTFDFKSKYLKKLVL